MKEKDMTETEEVLADKELTKRLLDKKEYPTKSLKEVMKKYNIKIIMPDKCHCLCNCKRKTKKLICNFCKKDHCRG